MKTQKKMLRRTEIKYSQRLFVLSDAVDNEKIMETKFYF